RFGIMSIRLRDPCTKHPAMHYIPHTILFCPNDTRPRGGLQPVPSDGNTIGVTEAVLCTVVMQRAISPDAYNTSFARKIVERRLCALISVCTEEGRFFWC